ncbi:hypothetical protein IFU30_11020 [Plantibacter sp. CFBP 8798]|uniref:hypothetical protein n=1 Tax=Plantibacter sp. CFBP 8798 TaxID=2775268 RepID=UPI0017869B16|nr:hypothetical protein [Plantibacter sp. CFBP 8798]MBD8466799.1 hypothetical protein [Plantibacter sp. CFBP 8798]
MAATTFKGAVREFMKANPWLGPAHAPATITLRKLAAELDREVTAALVAQYGVTYRNLLKQAPGAAPDVDEVGDLIDEARGL